MNEQKEKQEKSQKQEKPEKQSKPLSGTEETSVLEKAVGTIAGDNKLMGSVLKAVLSPFSLLLAASALVYCYFQIRKLKEEATKLHKENKQLKTDKILQEDELHKVKKKYKKLKEFNEANEALKLEGMGFVPKRLIAEAASKVQTYGTSVLD